MKFLLYAVRDAKAGMYLPPFIAGTDGVAVRMFADSCKRSDSAINAHPEDYSLHRIGTYDDQSAEIESTKVDQVSHASNFVQPGQKG